MKIPERYKITKGTVSLKISIRLFSQSRNIQFAKIFFYDL